MKSGKFKLDKLISIFFLVAMIIPLILLIIELIREKDFDQNKLVMLVVSILVLIAFFIPSILEKKFRLNIPAPIYISFLIFLYSSAFLGEIKRFFYIYPHWDTILHFSAGLMLGILGFSFVYLLNKGLKSIALSPFIIALFSLCFATTLGVIWEFFEYGMDFYFGTNMQKYMLENGTKFVGQFALKDTMDDLIINFAGSIISTSIGYFSIINNKKWAKDFLITKKD